jgi:type I restriction enzyme S subunit
VVRCASEFNVTMGQSPPGETYNEAGVGAPFYQGRRDFGSRYPARRVYCSSPKRYANAGDTLVTVRAPVGNVNMAAERCCVGRGVAAVRHRSGAITYTYEAMRSLRDDFADFEAGGTVFGSISGREFASLPVVMPPRGVIASFEDLVAPLEREIAGLYANTTSITELRDCLLPRLLDGAL